MTTCTEGERACTGILLAGMATVVLSAHGMLFLVAWEAMALAAFFLIASDDGEPEVRSAGVGVDYVFVALLAGVAWVVLFPWVETLR